MNVTKKNKMLMVSLIIAIVILGGFGSAHAGVDFSVDSDWGSGFVASMKIRNTGTQIDGWRIEFDFPHSITGIWNAKIISHEGNHYVLGNVSWNAEIGTGQSVSFGFQGDPGNVASAPSNITLNGTGIIDKNHPPVANDDKFETLKDKSLILNVLGNDLDPDGDTIAIADLSSCAHGELVLDFANESVTYQPDKGFIGADSFTYNISDGRGGVDNATVTIYVKEDSSESGFEFKIVNDWGSGFTADMIAVNDTGALVENWTVSFDFPYQITNIWNAEIISRSGDRYLIGNASWNGRVASGAKVSFGFQGSPGNISSTPLNVEFLGDSIPEENHPPVAVNDSAKTFTNQPIDINVLSNDYDLDGNSISIISSTLPISGATTVINSGTAFRYKPLQGFAGIDEFEYKISDGKNESFFARVLVTVEGIEEPEIPDISIEDVSIVEPDMGQSSGGYFHTDGNKIVDGAGNPVRIAGVNWFGLETENRAPHGLWTRNYKSMMNQMKELGFNTIRLPYSDALFDSGATPSGIDFYKNPELENLSGLEIMDKVVGHAKEIGMRIILDHHRSDVGSGPNDSGLWYTETYPESKWIENWVMLAQRYANNPTVIGADLHNEPHGPATWGSGVAETDWRLAAERAGNAILKVNSDWLILVEGIEFHDGENYWWGGNLIGAKAHPVRLDINNKLVYSPHAYPNSIYSQSWFSAPDYPQNLPAKWDQIWGYLHQEEIAPVLIGEFGSKFQDLKDVLWMNKLADYLHASSSIGGVGISWTWWSFNPNSGDTGGILQDDWNSVHKEKINFLTPFLFDLGKIIQTGGNGASPDIVNALFKVTLSSSFKGTIFADFAVFPGTADPGSDYKSVSGSLTFQAGETSKSISVQVLGDLEPEEDETFECRIENVQNANIGKSTASCLIIDNDQVVSDDKFRVVGYYANWAIYRTPSFKPKDINGDLLTHINYAFAKIDIDGNIHLFDSWADTDYREDWNSTKPYWGNFRQLNDLKARYPHLKVLISVGGWTLSNEFPAMAANPVARANFVQNCIDFCERYDCFDGIDIDWEYPGFAEHGGGPADKVNFTLLLKELDDAFRKLQPKLLLTIAAPAGPWHYQNMEVNEIHKYLDWINLMTYDFHGAWGGETETNHHAGLYKTSSGDDSLNIDATVKYYLSQGVPKNKLVLGTPLYGRSFAGATNTSNGLFSSFTGVGSATTVEAGMRFFYDIKRNLLGKYTRYWDPLAQVPFLHDENPTSPTYGEFITYEDEESLGVKCDYIRSNQLGGMMIWELGLDTWDEDWDAMSVPAEKLLK